MTTSIAILGGLIGAVLGWIASAASALLLSGYYGISDFEGARAMGSIFFFGPMGGLVGLVTGVWLALRLRTGQAVGGKALALRVPVVLAALCGLAAAVIGVLYWYSPILNPNGASPRLAFEIRLPSGVTPSATGLDVSLFTERNTMPATLAATQLRDGDRIVLSGDVELAYRSSWRILELKIPGTPEHIFVLRLSARPGHDRAFRDWEPVSNVGNGTDHPRLATDADAYEIRYRVIWLGEDE
ncbi:hypothetical protein [Hyphomicrobium sp.]|uniref:hypothetical protein n=1 Tax=Hyphomicrobium sp. TaxID=82 RepID=UPI002E36D63E|nr:hypothetical protein [Hyphomicrobium sp.]HEX2840906.1 hypothetical protein [Hyphomicrobium sp.]